MTDDDQFDLFGARKERDDGIDRVTKNSDQFLSLVMAEAHRITARKGFVSTDDLRRYAIGAGLKPRHPNVWGAIFKQPGWVKHGVMQSKKVSNHARWIHVWSFKNL